jgi:hypothetical protein
MPENVDLAAAKRNLEEAWKKVDDLLEYARGKSRDEVEALLVAALRKSKELAGNQVVATEDVDANYNHVVNFANKFLEKADGGARLVAVVGAFVSLVNDTYEVRVYHPNVADRFAGTGGDIEIYEDGRAFSAYECKHRPLTLDDVRHGVKKAKEKGLAEYYFVFAAGLQPGQERDIVKEIETAAAERDIILLNAKDIIPTWAAAVNHVRRAEFGKVVVDILRDRMRLADVANEAGDLWNSLE